MSSSAIKALVAIVAGATSVAAHGHVTGINVAGTWYEGYDPTSFPYMSDPPTVVGWTASDTDNGFVAPSAYASGDIICHKSATNAKGYATAKAGDTIEVYWNTWPTSHKGPVIDYLAKCAGDDCVTADKTALEFFKIDAVGLADASASTWGSDELISNNNSWVLQIPSTLATGNYVLRHEIIALHSAESAGGAQNYPQCFNLAITGTGSLQPSGTLGEALYKESDAGILVNIYNSLTSYDIPGPTQIAAGTNLAQSAVPITASASAVASKLEHVLILSYVVDPCADIQQVVLPVQLRQPLRLLRPPRLARPELLVLRLRLLPLPPRRAQLPPPRRAQLLRKYPKSLHCCQRGDPDADV